MECEIVVHGCIGFQAIWNTVGHSVWRTVTYGVVSLAGLSITYFIRHLIESPVLYDRYYSLLDTRSVMMVVAVVVAVMARSSGVA